MHHSLLQRAIEAERKVASNPEGGIPDSKPHAPNAEKLPQERPVSGLPSSKHLPVLDSRFLRNQDSTTYVQLTRVYLGGTSTKM